MTGAAPFRSSIAGVELSRKVGIQPKLANALGNRARAFEQKGDWSAAEEDLREALKLVDQPAGQKSWLAAKIMGGFGFAGVRARRLCLPRPAMRNGRWRWSARWARAVAGLCQLADRPWRCASLRGRCRRGGVCVSPVGGHSPQAFQCRQSEHFLCRDQAGRGSYPGREDGRGGAAVAGGSQLGA